MVASKVRQVFTQFLTMLDTCPQFGSHCDLEFGWDGEGERFAYLRENGWMTRTCLGQHMRQDPRRLIRNFARRLGLVCQLDSFRWVRCEVRLAECRLV